MAGAPAPRKAWIVVAALAALLGALSGAGAVVSLARGRWFEAVLGAGFARAGYWVVFGAWLRTPWADPQDVDAVQGPQPLTDRQLKRNLVIACLAGVAVTLALGLQAIDGRWVN